jgi:hypothetical protein
VAVNTRVAQAIVEVLYAEPATARVAQTIVEVAHISHATTRVAQTIVEYFQAQHATTRLAQDIVEILFRETETTEDELAALPAASTRQIRRLRQSPHLGQEQQWVFFSSFQLDLEAGVGLTTGQGSDPQVMLQWSDDGGHTWSNEHWTSAGALGAYRRRAIWRQLGRSRDRVWRVVISDPVKVAWLDAFVQVQGGTS